MTDAQSTDAERIAALEREVATLTEALRESPPTQYVIVRQDIRDPTDAEVDPTFVHGPFSSAADADVYLEYLERLDEGNDEVELDRINYDLDGMVATGRMKPEFRDGYIEKWKDQRYRRAMAASARGHRLVAYTVLSLSTPGPVRG